MSEVKVNKISPRTNCGTVTVGDSGDSVSVSAGVPVTVNGDLKSNALKATDGGSIISQCGTNITLGASGDTINLAAGASQSGFGRSGSVNWQTTPKTATFTAVDGEGYFINSGSSITANLPAGSAGAIVAFSDYARNFNTYNFVISPNGSEKIGGIEADLTLDVNGQAITLVYVDSTKGWVNVQNAQDTETGVAFMTATGGTITTSGNCKIHTFTGPGTFEVTQLGTSANNKLAYMVVAGGGGSGGNAYHIQGGGGGGAGGFREGRCNPVTPYTASPLVTTGITATVASFPITVGAGGGGGKGYGPSMPGSPTAGSGNNSVFSTITSAGGGYGGQPNSSPAPATYVQGADGGSGGGTGGGNSGAGGVGNTPPVNPPQGSNGGAGSTSSQTLGGSGGGATGTGSTAPGCSPPPSTPSRGAGATTHISASPVVYSTGGAYSHYNPSAFNPIGPASANTGNGADAQNAGPGPVVPQVASNYDGKAGGSGIVIIRYKFQ
jgi:hypothetical protein